MRKSMIELPDREKIQEELRRLSGLIEDMEDLTSALSHVVEDYMDDSDSMLSELGLHLEDLSEEHILNRMLWRELKASRKELCFLLRELSERGIPIPGGKNIHYGRLDPDLYPEDPELPLHYQDRDEHYVSLLRGQLTQLIHFEEYTPMTTAERDALREHVVQMTDFASDPEDDWRQFLYNLRNTCAQA